MISNKDLWMAEGAYALEEWLAQGWNKTLSSEVGQVCIAQFHVRIVNKRTENLLYESTYRIALHRMGTTSLSGFVEGSPGTLHTFKATPEFRQMLNGQPKHVFHLFAQTATTLGIIVSWDWYITSTFLPV